MTEKFISLKQAKHLIQTLGKTNTILVEAQPGVGKSSILKGFDTNQFILAYIDCANLDLGDLAMPVVCKDVMETRYAPNARFRVSEAVRTDKPLVVMLDELGKASKPVLNMLLPIMLERRLGDVMLPEGSIVFATTNLSTDGVGDNVPAHGYNRLTTIKLYGPTVQDWQEWAFDHGVEPVCIAWVNENPEAFDTYAHPLTGVNPKDNHYNFNPTKPGQNKFFVSHRSLAHAGPIVASREELGYDVMEAALAGTIGAPAAASMRTFITFADQLPKFAEVIAKPDTCRLPKEVGYFVSAVLMAGRIDAENCAAVLEYVTRWESDEAKCLFCQMAMRKTGNVSFLSKSRAYMELSSRVMSLVTA